VAIGLAKAIEEDRMAIIIQMSAKDKRSSLAKIGYGQTEIGRHLGFVKFAPDLFDCLAPHVGALLDQQLLVAALGPCFAVQLKIRLQPAMLQRIDDIVGDPADHRAPLWPSRGTFVLSARMTSKCRRTLSAPPCSGRELRAISGVISKYYRVSDIAVRCAETYIWLERNRL
jgi:hypothetical protein